ncbi:MAG: 4-hydroxy-tetrahydrodipicolinate reductase [Spirochaetaceae bacterium]|nr:MAG: 4-hydroxy-tetrahydrodipicolinate reductase [Spirochaetaceae bacterium]
MVRIIVHGCMGRMGRVLTATAAAAADIEVAAGIDLLQGEGAADFPVFASLDECSTPADVIVDFSSPKALPSLLEGAAKKKLPLIIATTGHTQEDKTLIAETSGSLPIFVSANMSLGVNLLSELAQKAATVLRENFDIEIIEKHHNQKKDAPSGTALLLADAINEVYLQGKHFVYGRHGREEQRQGADLGIHAIRGGTIVGEHEIVFAGKDEIVELRHSAASRQIFALGALEAVRYIMDKPPGLYSMKEMITAASAVTRLFVSNEEALVSLYRIALDPKSITGIFERLGKADINVDLISQTAPVDGEVNMSFTVFKKDIVKTSELVKTLQKSMKNLEVKIADGITKIAVEGPGMETQSGVAARVFGALTEVNVTIQTVTTSETKIALIIPQTDEGKAVAAIKTTFGL